MNNAQDMNGARDCKIIDHKDVPQLSRKSPVETGLSVEAACRLLFHFEIFGQLFAFVGNNLVLNDRAFI